MNITFEHPPSSVDQIADLVQEGVDVRTSPHIGSLDQASNPHYVTLGSLGVELEMVNTCTVDDRNGRPTIVVRDGKEIKVAELSRKEMKATLPCAVMFQGEGPSVFRETLEQYHLGMARLIGLRAQTSTEFLSSVGEQESLPRHDVAEALALSCTTLMRLSEQGRVSSDPAKRVSGLKAVVEHGIFGTGKELSSGLIVPVSAMMAAEVIGASLKGTDQVIHIGGSDMSEYTKDERIQAQVSQMASRACAFLGLANPKPVRYIVIDKNRRVAGLSELSQRISNAIGVENFSQHDTQLSAVLSKVGA